MRMLDAARAIGQRWSRHWSPFFDLGWMGDGPMRSDRVDRDMCVHVHSCRLCPCSRPAVQGSAAPASRVWLDRILCRLECRWRHRREFNRPERNFQLDSARNQRAAGRRHQQLARPDGSSAPRPALIGRWRPRSSSASRAIGNGRRSRVRRSTARRPLPWHFSAPGRMASATVSRPSKSSRRSQRRARAAASLSKTRCGM